MRKSRKTKREVKKQMVIPHSKNRKENGGGTREDENAGKK